MRRALLVVWQAAQACLGLAVIGLAAAVSVAQPEAGRDARPARRTGR